MATDVQGRNLQTCNICLEPFIGRHPKILLCSHTFCLPCLTTLSDSGAKCEETSDNGSLNSSFFKCPTCKKVIPVPKEGVSNFQPLFPCALCDGRQEAELKCQECDKLLCVQCCNFHDKIIGAKTHNLQSLDVNILSGMGNSDTSDVLQVAKQQLAVLNKAVIKLSVVESELDHQRQTLAGQIVDRCDLLMNLLKQARDTSLTRLRSLTQTILDDFREESKTARNVQMMLSDLITAAQCGALQNLPSFSNYGKSLPSASVTDLHRALLTEEDLKRFQHWADWTQQDSFFQYQPLDLAVTEESLLNYIGKVSTVHGVDERNTDGSGSSSVELRIQESSGSTTNDLKFSSQPGNVSVYQVTGNTDFVETYRQESEGNPDSMREERMNQNIILSEMQALQKNFTDLQDQTSVFKINTDLDLMSLKEQFATIQAEHSDFKRFATVEAELANLKRLPDQISSLKKENSKLRDLVATLKAEHTQLMQLQNQVTALKSEHIEVVKLHEKFESIKAVNTDLIQIRDQFATLKREQADLMLERYQLTAVKAELKDLTGLSKQVTTLKADLDRKIEKIKKESSQLSTQVTMLTNQIRKKPVVAFHVRLHKSIFSVAEARTLRLEDVITNVGEGYNRLNGIFTAPVSGIYIFLACASPSDAANSLKTVSFDICVDGNSVASSQCSESDTDIISQCTCQAVVNLNQGQQVFLKLQEKSSFYVSLTCFSGLLVHPQQ